MDDESAFLQGLLARPEDAEGRTAYADWLEGRGDPRAPFLRMDPELGRISYVAWLEKDGHLDFYLERFPDVKREAEQRQAAARSRVERQALAARLDPEWVAFVETLGCPFAPFFFFNNHGSPRECEPDELPFAERLGTRGPVVTFESDFRDPTSWDAGLARDLRFLTQLELEECAYGAATCPVHPFLCELKTSRRPLTGADVLASLWPRAFHSHHIRTLDATRIAYPGYQPGNADDKHNDEIHNDFSAQYLFDHGDEDEEVFEREDEDDVFDDDEPRAAGVDASSGAHGMLQRYVGGGPLWYVLLHTTAREEDGFRLSRYAVLLAVGPSPQGDRLLGVITHQVCHNLCD